MKIRKCGETVGRPLEVSAAGRCLASQDSSQLSVQLARDAGRPQQMVPALAPAESGREAAASAAGPIQQGGGSQAGQIADTHLEVAHQCCMACP